MSLLGETPAAVMPSSAQYRPSYRLLRDLDVCLECDQVKGHQLFTAYNHITSLSLWLSTCLTVPKRSEEHYLGPPHWFDELRCRNRQAILTEIGDTACQLGTFRMTSLCCFVALLHAQVKVPMPFVRALRASKSASRGHGEITRNEGVNAHQCRYRISLPGINISTSN